MLYFIVPKKWQWVVILIANVLFYIASGIKYLIYIIFVSFIAYWIALGIEKVNVLSAKTMKAVEDSETKKEVKSGNLYINVNTDQTEHTARRFSAWLPPIQCTLSGHQCMLIIQV